MQRGGDRRCMCEEHGCGLGHIDDRAGAKTRIAASVEDVNLVGARAIHLGASSTSIQNDSGLPQGPVHPPFELLD